LAGKNATELMFSSSKRAACFHEEAVGKTEKTGIDTDEEGAAE